MSASALAATSRGAPGSDGQPETSPSDQIGARKESILTGGINDKETEEDSLGFAPYVDALTAFLVNSATKPPLTISIEGEWGSGKSSFMRQLRKRIMDAETLLPRDSRSFIVWFNPWRHDKQDALWAAFALEFLRQVRAELRVWPRWARDLRLFRMRFAWTSGWTDLVRKVLQVTWWLLVIAMLSILSWNAPTYLQAVREPAHSGPSTKVPTAKNSAQAPRTELPTGLLDWGIRLGGGCGTLVLAVYLFDFAKKQLANPIKVDLQRHLACPRYEGSVSFVEEFHRDFDKILGAYTSGRRVYVFIDDLDRCEVPRAADLMQAINLLISEDPQLIFVIGMDWDTVAAGIAVKHEALCRYLTPGARLFVGAAGTTPMIDKAGCRHNENDENTREGYTDTYDAMEFGREFLDKFVQLRFKVPRPSNEDLRRLLLALSRPQAAGTHRSTSQARPALWRARVVSWLRALVSQSGKLAENRKVAESSKGKTQQSGEPVSQTTELKELIEFGTNADSDTIRAVALRLMPAFDNNPRRLKQFLGLYRLRIYIAKVTGMFAIPKGEAADRALSLPQLGKFTALELGWPDLLKEAQLNTELFGRLEQEAHRQEAAGFYWRRRGLAEVIRAGLDGDEAARQQWSLAGLDFRRLLRVSASVGPFDAKIGSPPDAPEVATRPQHDATAEEWVERGRAAAENNEKLRCYTEAIKLRPDYAPAFLSRGNVLAELGAIDRALADYDEAIRLKPHDASALYNRGMAYSDKGDRDRALMDYDEAIRLKPDDADAFINRGIARANNDDVVGALADFDQAVQLRPDDVDGYYNRSIERHRKGDLEGALSDDNQAARLKLGNTDAV